MKFTALFSKTEIKDMLIAILALTLIFSATPFPNPGIEFNLLPVYLVAVITAFACHEIAHKLTAMRLNCLATFKLWPRGTLIGILLMFTGIKFASPGVVMIYPFRFGRWGFRYRHLTHVEEGLIALAGPLTNLIFATLFSIIPGWPFHLLYLVNAWIYLFNMLPIPPLDGSKIILWNVGIWTFFFILSVILCLPIFLG